MAMLTLESYIMGQPHTCFYLPLYGIILYQYMHTKMKHIYTWLSKGKLHLMRLPMNVSCYVQIPLLKHSFMTLTITGDSQFHLHIVSWCTTQCFSRLSNTHYWGSGALSIVLNFDTWSSKAATETCSSQPVQGFLPTKILLSSQYNFYRND